MRKVFIVLILLNLPYFLVGQFNCMFSHYSTSNGLSSGAIGAIIRDHEGYIWVGTWDGLNRFDGHNFTTFKSKPGDSNILSSWKRKMVRKLQLTIFQK